MDLKSSSVLLLGLLCVATLASAAPITAADATCSGGTQVVTIPENSAEASFLLTCPGFALSPTVDQKIAVFLDTSLPNVVVSDLVTFANVNGAANFTFVSDLDTGGTPLVAPPASVTLTTVTEPTPVVVVATSTTGAQLQFTFSSDVNEAAGVPSETISIAPIPEPASLTLAGLGGLVLLCGLYLRKPANG